MITNRKACVAALAALVTASPSLPAQESPHWNKATCQACHLAAAPTAGQAGLNAPDAETLCNSCHGDRGDAKSCRHASAVPAAGMVIDASLADAVENGQVVCTTCHDAVFQCERPKEYYHYENPGFLRERSSRDTGAFCFRCHQTTTIEKLNPHEGVYGSPLKPTCALCHEGVPQANQQGGIELAFNMQNDLNDMCRGCHNVRPHPKNLFASKSSDEWVHLVVPTVQILENMRETTAETGIELPLDPVTGMIFCATCHNPHGFKLGGEHGSQSLHTESRLRIETICQACHDK